MRYPNRLYNQSFEKKNLNEKKKPRVKWNVKRDVLHPQYFYNIFTTNHKWLVVIGSNLNLTLKLLFYPNNNNQ